MLYDEAAVRANIRNREGKRVFFLPRDGKLTSSARDFLTHEKIAIMPGDTAKILEYRGLNGEFYREKPERMTHLQGNILVDKTHPRIAFRGEMDALQAEIMLCQLEAEAMREQLGAVLDFARNLIRCDVLDEPVGEPRLCGMTADELRERSHFPQDHYGQPHFLPEYRDGRVLLLLNRCRCAARRAELAAVRAFPEREDMLRAMNRLSSMLYILMIREKAGRRK